MNDTVRNGVLECEHEQVEDLANDGETDLDQTKNVSNFITSFDKFTRVLIGNFHNVKTFADFWVNDEVQSQDTGNLDVKEREVGCIHWNVLWVCHNGIVANNKHCESISLNCQRLVEHLCSLCVSEPEFGLVLLQECENGHGGEILLEVKMVLLAHIANDFFFSCLVDCYFRFISQRI